MLKNNKEKLIIRGGSLRGISMLLMSLLIR